MTAAAQKVEEEEGVVRDGTVEAGLIKMNVTLVSFVLLYNCIFVLYLCICKVILCK